MYQSLSGFVKLNAHIAESDWPRMLKEHKTWQITWVYVPADPAWFTAGLDHFRNKTENTVITDGLTHHNPKPSKKMSVGLSVMLAVLDIDSKKPANFSRRLHGLQEVALRDERANIKLGYFFFILIKLFGEFIWPRSFWPLQLWFLWAANTITRKYTVAQD